MKKAFIALSLAALAWPSMAAYYVAGDFQGWNAGGSILTETSPGSGIWQGSFTGLTLGRHEFKITQGTWDWNFPGPNSWLYTDDGSVTITYDANTYSDGWSGASQRIGLSKDAGAWTAVGDWQGWNNANGTTAMTSLGGGIYKLSYNIALAGSYQYKAVSTGTWDAIGGDSRNVNAGTLSFTTSAENQTVDFFVNALNGTIRADVQPTPEPSTLALFGLGAVALVLRARRR